MWGKKNRALAGVVAACACFVAAIGVAPLRFTSFHAAGNGVTENPCVDGMCKVKYKRQTDMSSIQITIRDLKPNTTYGVLLDGDGSGFSDPLAFTTDCHGHGSYTRDFPQDATIDTILKVYVWDGDIDTIFDVSDDEVRAVGVIESDDDEDD
jgi:hypothetical protein